MATDPTSPPQSDGQSEATSKRSRTTTRLRTLTLRTVDQPRPAVYVDPATGRASGSMREKFHSYLGVVAREKVPIIHNNWKDVPETLKDIVWNDILVSPSYQIVYLNYPSIFLLKTYLCIYQIFVLYNLYTCLLPFILNDLSFI